MADLLKRLEEIERQVKDNLDIDKPWHYYPIKDDDADFLLRLTRALLESQGELMEEVRGHACCRAPHNPCSACNAISRAEKVRKGEV